MLTENFVRADKVTAWNRYLQLIKHARPEEYDATERFAWSALQAELREIAHRERREQIGIARRIELDDWNYGDWWEEV